MDKAALSDKFFHKGLFKGTSLYKSIAWLAFLCCLVLFFPHSIQRQAELGIDYPIFYKAAQNHGEAEGYIYPPLLAWLIYPLAILPYKISSQIWYILQAIVILIVLWRTLPNRIIDNNLKIFFRAIFITAAFRLVMLNAELGQVNGLILLLILVGMESARPSVSGAVLGLATAIKISPALFLPYALLRQKGTWGRSIILYIVTVGFGLALPWLFGYNFSGITGLVQLTAGASANMGLFEYAGSYSYFISVMLAAVSFVIAWRVKYRWEVWLIPVILVMIAPPVVRKAHLLAGLLLGVLFDKSTDRLSWVPFVWAAGTLGTIVWPPSAIIGNVIALFILLYDLALNNPLNNSLKSSFL